MIRFLVVAFLASVNGFVFRDLKHFTLTNTDAQAVESKTYNDLIQVQGNRLSTVIENNTIATSNKFYNVVVYPTMSEVEIMYAKHFLKKSLMTAYKLEIVSSSVLQIQFDSQLADGLFQKTRTGGFLLLFTRYSRYAGAITDFKWRRKTFLEDVLLTF